MEITMKQEYHKGNMTLRILDASYAGLILDFYAKNKDCFDPHEVDKPDNFYTIDFITRLVNAEYNAFLHGRGIRFFLFDKNVPDTIIGTISFSDLKRGAFRSCCTGYKIAKKYQCQGYGTAMLTLALDIMKTEYKMHRIEAYISPDNTPSIHLVNNVGFICEGTAYSYVKISEQWKDHLRFVYIHQIS
jgi:ribosomal-protein-alanine N-acetyltransferase